MIYRDAYRLIKSTSADSSINLSALRKERKKLEREIEGLEGKTAPIKEKMDSIRSVLSVAEQPDREAKADSGNRPAPSMDTVRPRHEKTVQKPDSRRRESLLAKLERNREIVKQRDRENKLLRTRQRQGKEESL